MTIELMRYFGISTNWQNNSIFVKEGTYHPQPITIEADWSAASYWYGMAAASKEAKIDVLGLKKESLQGDAVIANIYKRFGVETAFIDGGIRLTKHSTSNPSHLAFNYDFTDCPDLAQTVAVTCSILNIPARLTGLATLRIKETDRVLALKTELSQLGYSIEIDNDSLIIVPHQKEQTEITDTIKTYNDHRMAMAFSAFALKHPIIIEDEQVVKKSYPSFWKDLKQVGFQ